MSSDIPSGSHDTTVATYAVGVDVVAELAAQEVVTQAMVIDAWRAWPLVELAALVVEPLPHWLEATHDPTALQRIVGMPRDPRDAPALLALVRLRPHAAKEDRKFWTTALQLLHQVADARVHAALPDLLAQPVATELDTYLVDKLKAIASRPPSRTWPKATPRELDLIARIATRLGGGVVEKTAESFLADVWAHPLDDAPRELFAAWLLQRGDPRGELITLQLERHRGSESTAKRERALLVEHGRLWLGPLEPVISNQYTFERGFLFRCKISWRKLAAAPQLFKHPAWATVREYILDPAGEKTCDAWLDHMIAVGAKRK